LISDFANNGGKVYASGMRKYFLVLLLLAPLSAMAAIYKSVDSNGDVVFSDKPSPDAKEIPTPSPNTVHLPKAPPPEAAKKEKKAKDTIYTSLTITSPGSNETIHSNPGIVNIMLRLTPELNIKAGDRVNILVDNYVLLRQTSQLSVKIPDINRGTHTVQAVVTNKQGATLIKSDEVQFFMQRQSVLNKPGASRVSPHDVAGNPIQPGPQNTWFKPGSIPPSASKEKP
jgi:hypothetical protein